MTRRRVSLTDIFKGAASLLRRNTAETIFLTIVLTAVEITYGCLLFIFACSFIPGFMGKKLLELELPDSYSPQVVCIIGIAIVLGYMIVTPLSFGVDWCFYHAARGRQIPLECLFACITDKDRRRRVWLINVVSSGCRIVIAIASAALIRTFQTVYDQAVEVSSTLPVLIIMYTGTGALIAFFAAVYFFLSARYFMVPYIFAEDPGTDARMGLLKSVKLTENHRKKVLLLQLIFLPMYALCVLGFPFIAVIPLTRSLSAVCAVSLFDSADEAQNEDFRTDNIL